MFPSITNTDIAEQPARSSPPWVWIGFLFAGTFFMIEVFFVILELDEPLIDLILRLVLIAGGIYWLFCVHRIHKILNEMSSNRYPITANEAAWKHLIPFYNLVWIFKWPAEFSDYINSRGRVRVISGYVIGAMLLLALLLRLVDGAFGMAFLFGVTMFVSAKLKRHIKSGQTVSAEELPPLPDPRIFGQPVESAASPAQPVTETEWVK